MRRSLLVLLLALALGVPFAPPAAATGPGGWNHLGTGPTPSGASLNGSVAALHAVGTSLYVGGTFTDAGGQAAADRIARWNGTSWAALGTTSIGNGGVLAIAQHGGKIYAGGTFQDAGGNPDADNLAVFDGTGWAPACGFDNHPGSATGYQVAALQVIGSTLYIGGPFQNGAGIVAADYLVSCDLTTGTPSATVDNDGDFTGGIHTLTADSNGVLYAGGGFQNLDQIAAADNIASYDGSWHALATGVPGFVRAITAAGTNVYVSSDALDIGGLPKADHVARWNGTSWSALGANTAGTNGWFPTTAYLYSMTTFGSLVFATGSFQNANGVATADNVAYFDGVAWRPIGSNGAGNGPWIGEGHALSVFSGQLYAGGSFTSAGGDTQARGVASMSLRLADAWIGTYSGGTYGHYLGNNIYNTTTSGQTRSMTILRGRTQYFPVIIQNDGLVTANYKVRGIGAAPGFSVAYFNAANSNITTAVRNGTYVTPALARGATFSMKMRVTLSTTATGRGSFLVHAISTAGTPIDVVRGLVTAG